MSKDGIITAFFVLSLLFLLYQIFLILSPFFEPIFWAGLLSFCFFPLYKFLLARFSRNENLAAFSATLCLLAVLLPLNLLVLFQLSEQAMDFFHRVIVFTEEGHLQSWVVRIKALPLVSELESRLERFDFIERGLQDWVLSQSKGMANFVIHEMGVLTRNIVSYGLKLFLTFLLFFAFLKHGERLYRFLYDLTPLDEADRRVLFVQAEQTFAAVVRGQLLTSFVQAVVAGIIFRLLGLPAPILLATATFLFSLVPVTGAATVWAPCVIYLLFVQQTAKAVILLFLGLSVISLIDNFMKPAIIGEKLKLPYALLFLGVLGGMKVYGLIGIFIAPVVFSLFFSLAKIYNQKRAGV